MPTAPERRGVRGPVGKLQVSAGQDRELGTARSPDGFQGKAPQGQVGESEHAGEGTVRIIL